MESEDRVVQRSSLKVVNTMYRDERRNQITVERPGVNIRPRSGQGQTMAFMHTQVCLDQESKNQPE